jgi:hypothetical protein
MFETESDILDIWCRNHLYNVTISAIFSSRGVDFMVYLVAKLFSRLVRPRKAVINLVYPFHQSFHGLWLLSLSQDWCGRENLLKLLFIIGCF